ncbi:DUF190 domain-containing protein [Desulfovibrio aminophilus]|uniref:DUF190 domain-containing protein n=1 Tax=Desulfovibrio aminophilus TaxID=81425 RepID=UPI00041BB3C0|nr:DUF190 domain-containing protein [Desulfovibrio aminophilus]
MHIKIDAEILRVYVGESDQIKGRPLFEIVAEEARKRGLAGATVLRGVLGFGANSLVHTAKILRLSEDLPMVVEIVDRPERITAFLPWLEETVSEGAVIRQQVQATFFHPMRVSDVMTADVATVPPDAPLSRILAAMLERDIKAVPVVQDGTVLGIVTGGDLLERGGMSLRLSLHRELPGLVREAQVKALDHSGKTARDVMTAPVATIGIRAKVPEAARLMAKKKIKRLPVLDERGKLAGIVSRIDVLRTIATAASVADSLPGLPGRLDGLARDVMLRDVPTVAPDAPLDQALKKILSSPLRRVVVVDQDRRMLGIILDRDLFRRFAEKTRSGPLQSLAALFSRQPAEPSGLEGTAAQAMRTTVFSIAEETPVSLVLQEMVQRKAKRLVVTDGQGHLSGMVDRDQMLKAIGGVQ